MTNRKTITSNSSVLMLAIAGVIPTAQRVQGFSADAAFAFDDVNNKEIVAGIDGTMSAGYIYTPTPQKITVMPNSNSYEIFAAWREAENAAAEVFFADGTVSIPATGFKYTMSKGVLSKTKAAPTVGKTLQPIEYEITWESVTWAPI